MASEYVVTHLGDTYVVWPGLLVAGHQLGLRSIVVELLQAPSPDNGFWAICRAQVTTDRGTFTALADAHPNNAGRSDVHTLLLQAQLRAKTHALCDALNLPLKPVEDLATYRPRLTCPLVCCFFLFYNPSHTPTERPKPHQSRPLPPAAERYVQSSFLTPNSDLCQR